MPPSRYDRIALELFQSKYRPGDTVVAFSRQELLASASRIGVDIKNAGDFPYYYGKRHGLPEPIHNEGFTGIEIIGKSTYAFTKAEDAIESPKEVTETEVLLILPSGVRKFITDDEQGMLVKVRHSDILSDFVGEKVFHLQSHLRTESRELGQVEIDDVYVTDESGRIVAVEAATANEKMIRSQIRRQVAGAVTRFKVASKDVISVVIRILEANRVIVMRLDADLKVSDARVFRFKEVGGGLQTHLLGPRNSALDESPE